MNRPADPVPASRAGVPTAAALSLDDAGRTPVEDAEALRSAPAPSREEAEARLRALFDGFPLPTYAWRWTGDDFVLAGFNAAASAYTRGHIADFVGCRAGDLYWDRPDIREDLARCLESRGVRRREMDYRMRINGEFKRLDVTYVFLPPDRVIVHTEDLTDRKRTEAEVRLLQGVTLAVSEAEDLDSALGVLLRRVCEAGGWALGQAWTPAPDGSCLVCSRAFHAAAEGLEDFRVACERMRLPADVGLPGRVWSSKRPVWVRDLANEPGILRREAVREAALHSCMAFPVLARGEVLAVIEFFVREPREEDARLVRVVSTVADQLASVLDRKRALAALRESEDRYRRLVETAPEVVYTLSADDATITSLNPAFEAITGWRCGEWIGRPFAGLLHLDDLPGAFAMFREVLAGRTPPPFEVRIRTREGAFLVAEVVGTPVIEGGRVVRVLGYGRDVTERRRAEEHRRDRSQQLLFQLTSLLDLSKMEEAGAPALMRIAETSARTLGVERVGVWLFSPDRSELVCHDLYRASRRVHEQGLRIRARDYPRYFRAIEDASCIAADGARTDPRTSEFTEAYLAPLGITSMLDIAVRLHGRVAGVVCHEHVGPPRVWTQEEQHFAAAIADRVSLVLEASERRRAEEALRASEAKWRTLVENAPNFIMTVDRSGTILFINRTLPSYTVEEVVGSSVFDHIPPPYHDRVRQALAKVFERGEPAGYEVPGSGPAGAFWYSTQVGPIREGGQVVAAMLIASDLTERKRTEEDLEQSLSLLRATLESTADGILVVDPEGRITSFNRRFVDMWRIPESIVESRDDNQALDFVLNQLRDPGGFLSKVRELYGRPEAESYDILEFRDGRVFERYSRPQRIGGRSVGRVWSFRDITERRASEQALRESRERLEQAHRSLQEQQAQMVQSEKMASLGLMAAGIAHEINNPVAFVTSNLGILAEYVGVFKDLLAAYERLAGLLERSPARLRAEGASAGQARSSRRSAAGATKGLRAALARLRELHRKTDLPYLLQDVDVLLADADEGMRRVREIVQGLRSFAHSDETGPVEADLNEGIEATLKVVWNALKYKCRVRKELGSLPPLRCWAGQINQVFLNLLLNAAEAIPEQGEITIRTVVEDAHLVVSFADTGAGIAPEHLPHLFTPFFTTKPVGKGTGLGLFISYGIVRKHGGTIEVRSEPGQGTVFTVRLPVRGVEDADRQAADSKQPMAGGSLPRRNAKGAKAGRRSAGGRWKERSAAKPQPTNPPPRHEDSQRKQNRQ